MALGYPVQKAVPQVVTTGSATPLPVPIPSELSFFHLAARTISTCLTIQRITHILYDINFPGIPHRISSTSRVGGEGQKSREKKKMHLALEGERVLQRGVHPPRGHPARVAASARGASSRDAANFIGLVLGCIETKFCK